MTSKDMLKKHDNTNHIFITLKLVTNHVYPCIKFMLSIHIALGRYFIPLHDDLLGIGCPPHQRAPQPIKKFKQ